MSRDCCVAIPLSVMGLSAVCDCDTHYFWVSFMRTAMAFATFAWSSPSLSSQFKILQMAIECHFVRAAKDLVSLHICTSLPQSSSLYKISCAALNGDLCAIHASSEYSGESAHLRKQSLDNIINIKISCAGSKGSWEYARLHRLA